MIRRIDNIIDLLEKVDDDTLLGHLSLNKYPGIDWENLIWENLDMAKVRKDIYEEIRTDSFSCLGAIEEYLCMCNSLDDVKVNDEYVSDYTNRCSGWLIPLTSIFKYYGYDYEIDFVNECIHLDIEDDEDFSNKLGIDMEKLLGYGAYNSFMYYEFIEQIDKLYDRVRRNDKLMKLEKIIRNQDVKS